MKTATLKHVLNTNTLHCAHGPSYFYQDVNFRGYVEEVFMKVLAPRKYLTMQMRENLNKVKLFQVPLANERSMLVDQCNSN